VVQRVKVENSHITITEKIQFADAKSDILPASNSLLDEIASVIKAHTEIKKIRVEGHTSSEGKAAANQKLSDERAKAVVAALVTRGVDKSILTAKGFGSSQLLEKPDDTEEKKEKNRRVDFVITDPKDPNAPADTSKAPKMDKGAKGDKKMDKGTKPAGATTAPKGKP
jgi:outer membrane protein OmpA-like peptidoglycan-associated protein